jgi:hypothetical protein
MDEIFGTHSATPDKPVLGRGQYGDREAHRLTDAA